MSGRFASVNDDDGDEPTAVKERAVDAYASHWRVSADIAKGIQTFQARVAESLDELRSALGARCGDIWCDLNPPGEVRLKVGVAGSGYPPAGKHVQAAKLVLQRHGLLEASDFVEVSVGMAERLADLARVSAVLGDAGQFARASLRTESHSRGALHAGNLRTTVWIETVRGLTSEQKAIVEYAATVAHGPVQIQACIAQPGWEFAPTPLQEVEWAPVGVGADHRSLNLMYSWDVIFGLAPALILQETSSDIQIAVLLPDLMRDPDVMAIPSVKIGRLSRRLVVRLAEPIGGRRITGAGGLLSSGETGIARDPLLQHRAGGNIVVPNVAGLHPDDAQKLLRLQGLDAEIGGSGSEVTDSEPAASELAPQQRPIFLRTTPG